MHKSTTECGMNGIYIVQHVLPVAPAAIVAAQCAAPLPQGELPAEPRPKCRSSGSSSTAAGLPGCPLAKWTGVWALVPQCFRSGHPRQQGLEMATIITCIWKGTDNCLRAVHLLPRTLSNGSLTHQSYSVSVTRCHHHALRPTSRAHGEPSRSGSAACD